MNFIALGACPEQEEATQPIGATKEYIPKMLVEAQAYKLILALRFVTMLKENNKVKLEIRSFGNDTQPFLNVVVVYDETDEIQSQCATIISENLPQTWRDLTEFYVCL